MQTAVVQTKNVDLKKWTLQNLMDRPTPPLATGLHSHPMRSALCLK